MQSASSKSETTRPDWHCIAAEGDCEYPNCACDERAAAIKRIEAGDYEELSDDELD